MSVIRRGRAVVCPICNGTGKSMHGNDTEKCHGCSGRGWVEVHDEVICTEPQEKEEGKVIIDPYNTPFKIYSR